MSVTHKAQNPNVANKNILNNISSNVPSKTTLSSIDNNNNNHANSSVMLAQEQSQLLHSKTPVPSIISKKNSNANNIGTSSFANKNVHNAKIVPVMPTSGHTASTAVNHPNTKTKLPKEPLVKKGSSSSTITLEQLNEVLDKQSKLLTQIFDKKLDKLEKLIKGKGPQTMVIIEFLREQILNFKKIIHSIML